MRDPGLVLGRWADSSMPFSTRNRTSSDSTSSKGFLSGLSYTLSESNRKKNEAIAALRSITNAKAMGPDELPFELLKLGLNHDPIVLREFHRMIKLVWHQQKFCGCGEMP